MEVVVRQGEREERVTVRRASLLANGFEVTVGERTYLVDLAKAGGALSLRIAGDQHEVSVRPVKGPAGVYQVATAAGSAVVEVADPLTALAARGRSGGGGKRRSRVNAYMPGRVVAILAAEGSEVKAGAGVIVLEAMKMQNEIQAEHDGRITKVHVEPGQAVEGGDPLFDLE